MFRLANVSISSRICNFLIRKRTIWGTLRAIMAIFSPMEKPKSRLLKSGRTGKTRFTALNIAFHSINKALSIIKYKFFFLTLHVKKHGFYIFAHMKSTPTQREEIMDNQSDLLPILKICYYQFISNWKWFLASVIVCLVAGWYYQQRQSRVFHREAVMLIEDAEGTGSNMTAARRTRRGVNAAMDLSGISVGDNLKNELFIISSLRLMERVSDSLGLDVDYTMQRALHTVSLYDKRPVEIAFAAPATGNVAFTVEKKGEDACRLSSFEGLEDEEAGKTSVDARFGVPVNTPVGRLTIYRAEFFTELAVGDRFKVTRYTPKTAAQICKSKISATEYDKESSLVVIGCNDVNARRAEDILNEIFEAYKRDVVDNKNRVSQNTADFVEERIALIGEELSRVENQLVNFKKQNGIINFIQSTQTFTTESAAARKLTLELATQLSIAEYLADYVNSHANSHELIPSLNLPGGDFNSQIAAYNTLMNERNRLAGNSSETQAIVREHDRQLAEMRTAIAASLRSYVQTVKMQLRDARGNENQLSGNMAGVPEKEKQGLDIQRQQSLKEALYTYLLNKREEVALQLAINEANVRLVEAPLGSAKPVSPRRGVIMLISLVLGLAIPSLILWLRTLLDVSVSGRKDIEDYTNIPIAGELPRWKTEAKQPNITTCNNDAPIVEAFRMLRYGLNFMRRNARVFVTTSSTPGQGKSFVSTNLSVVFGKTGKKVLLIDGDIRKRTLSHNYGKNAGLTGYLIDDGNSVTIDDIVIPNAIDNNVDFIPAGMLPPNPSELLMSDRLEELIRRASERYDYIVIDTTPMFSVADAGILSRVAEVTLYVIRVGIQDKSFLPDLERMYQNKRFNNLCIILNDADIADPRYSCSYGYGYGYATPSRSRGLGGQFFKKKRKG